MQGPLVEIKELTKHFEKREGFFGRRTTVVQALDRVSMTINRGQTAGVVGESGCGKTTLGRCVLRLIPSTAGEVWIDGENVLEMEGEELRTRRQYMQMISTT